MHILRIEHEVADYDAWKRMFDSDPIGRSAGGVGGHRVARPASDPNRVQVDLEFANLADAEVFETRLRELWERVDVMQNPTAQIVEVVESAQY